MGLKPMFARLRTGTTLSGKQEFCRGRRSVARRARASAIGVGASVATLRTVGGMQTESADRLKLCRQRFKPRPQELLVRF